MNYLASESGCFCGIPESQKMELLTPPMRLEEFPGGGGDASASSADQEASRPTEAHTKVAGEDDVQEMLIWSVSCSPCTGGSRKQHLRLAFET